MFSNYDIYTGTQIKLKSKIFKSFLQKEDQVIFHFHMID